MSLSSGAELSQVLDRVLVPPPHDAVQLLHSDQCPSTVIECMVVRVSVRLYPTCIISVINFGSCLNRLFILGQSCKLQVSSTESTPLHSSPPCSAKTKIDLVFILHPPAHDREQSPVIHSLHSQSTLSETH